MQRWAFTAVGLFLISAKAAVAAPPVDAASGVYVVRYPAALFAFRVDPWSDEMHLVRGLGRGEIDDEYDVYLEIAGTYRPSRNHVAQGVFLLRQADGTTQSIPWRGVYQPQEKSFQWAMVVDGTTMLLLPAKAESGASLAPETQPAPTAPPSSGSSSPPAETSPADGSCDTPPSTTQPAAGSPSAGVGLFAKGSKSADLTDEDGKLDFGKVITHIVVKTLGEPPPQSTTPAAKKSDGTAYTKNELENIAIIMALIDQGAGKNKSTANYTPKQLLDWAIQGNSAGGPIRKRGEYKPLDQPRVPKTLTKPQTPGTPTAPATPTAPGSELVEPLPPGLFPQSSKTASGVKAVPNCVGMKFEDAVSVLFSAGLYPGSVDCVGHAKDPAQAERVVSQTPASGAPYPADGNIRLQWYAPMERPPGTPDGFQPGDGVKVDIRFVDANTNGRSIGRGGLINDEPISWSVYKLDDPQVQEAIASVRKSMRETMAGEKRAIGTYKNDDSSTTTIMQRSDVAGDLIFAYTNFGHSNEIFRDRTHHYRLHEYRGFLIWYLHSKDGRSQPLAAVADTVIENSRRLIDLRFPK